MDELTGSDWVIFMLGGTFGFGIGLLVAKVFLL